MDLCVTNHSTTLMLLENDGTGHFTDITAGSGMEVSGFFLQSKFEDFDNDGFIDFMTSGDNSSNFYFKGNGDGTFAQLDWPFAYGDAMLSFATGDVARDGQMDLIASYGSVYVSPDNNNPDQLYINEGSDNHWVCFDLQGIESNSDAVGAQVAIYGPWGTQLRDVRAGESYGITCTTHPHFGLGMADYIDSAVVHFPSGFTVTLTDPAIDTYHNVIEAPCQIGAFDLTLEGASVLCPGETSTHHSPCWLCQLCLEQWSRHRDRHRRRDGQLHRARIRQRRMRRCIQCHIHRGLPTRSAHHHNRRRPEVVRR